MVVLLCKAVLNFLFHDSMTGAVESRFVSLWHVTHATGRDAPDTFMRLLSSLEELHNSSQKRTLGKKLALKTTKNPHSFTYKTKIHIVKIQTRFKQYWGKEPAPSDRNLFLKMCY